MGLKEFKKDLRNLKNQWVFKEYLFNGKIYQIKRFGLDIPIFREKISGINIPIPAGITTQKKLISIIKESIK